MMTPPIIRVGMPHDVVWHSFCRPASLRQEIPNVRAQFVPR
jgi:hypothetical protein